MKKKLLLPLLPLLCLPVLTTAALAAAHTDGSGTVWDADGYYAPEVPALLAAADADADAYYETKPLTPLGDPSGLRWNPETPGEILWETKGAFQRELKIAFYRVGGPDEPVLKNRHTYGASHTITSFSDAQFLRAAGEGWADSCEQPLSTGDYYFTVQNTGDGVTYGDSATVSSLDLPGGVYHYVEPAMDTTLETPAQGHWEWPAAVWDDRQKEDQRMETYFIGYGWSEAPAQSPEDIRFIGGSYAFQSGREDFWLQDRLIGEHGSGWYYFRVRPISADIEKWRNGAWSPWSEGYNLAEAAREITESLKAIDKSAPAEDVREAVQKLGRTRLHNALTADILEAGTGAADALAALEASLGGPAKPQVAPELADRFDQGGVSIVGAALNTPSGAEAPVLNIGAPRENHVRDENYSSTVAVDFSMDLEGVENTHDLAVPVKVTLPVPAGVNPDFLAILHYRADGGFEEVLHTVFRKDGKWYASFVLTGFSDFTLTEKATSIETGPGGGYQAVNPPEGARLALARYEGGRLTAFQALKALSGTLEGSGKLFLLDEGFRPLCPAGDLRP